jgi:hypothetical protein
MVADGLDPDVRRQREESEGNGTGMERMGNSNRSLYFYFYLWCLLGGGVCGFVAGVGNRW